MVEYKRVQSRAMELLLVEDNPADVELTQRALDHAEFHVSLMVAEDGEEAMAILRKEGHFAKLPRPDLILLDLNLPKKDGREVLAELHSDDDLGRIPVAVITSSRSELDRRYAYEKEAVSYINKPVATEEFDRAVRELLNYWVNVAIPGE